MEYRIWRRLTCVDLPGVGQTRPARKCLKSLLLPALLGHPDCAKILCSVHKQVPDGASSIFNNAKVFVLSYVLSGSSGLMVLLNFVQICRRAVCVFLSVKVFLFWHHSIKNWQTNKNDVTICLVDRGGGN